MFKNLSPNAIGIRGLALPDVIELAAQTGYMSIDFNIRDAALAAQRGIGYVSDLLAAANMRPGQWGLPVAWNNDQQWEQDLAELPKLAEVGVALGITTLPPRGNTRPRSVNPSSTPPAM